MMLPNSSQIWGLLCLGLYANLAVAGLIRRDGAPTSSTSELPSTSTGGSSSSDGDSATSTPPSTATGSVSSSLAPTTLVTVSTTSLAPAPSASYPLNTTLFNSTIPADQLPLTPTLTPGWGVAGIVLMGTGVVYALVGIKTRLVHTFFSTAYLTSLGTAVLIVYVMALPVSNAVQGAYVVAVVCTGLVFGGAAIMFKEMAECLGCLLGGFCFSMWLLTLQPGGLVTAEGARVAVIAAFSLAGFATYFSHWTRSYSLIICISFSGATATVLGIDAFSQAGLKEFWAYLWGLNENLFPLGTVTYPLTKDIRVELAATILIFVAGIFSQLRLWRIIQERRAKRAAARAEVDRELQAEEENVNRQVRETTNRERREWERVYGDGANSEIVGDSTDSGVGHMEGEKAKRGSGTTTATPGSLSNGEADDPIEMADLPSDRDGSSPVPKPTAAEMVITQDGKDGVVTVRVASDDVPNGPLYGSRPAVYDAEKNVWVLEGNSEETLIPALGSRRSSKSAMASPSITPLPFRIPEAYDEEGIEEGDDRSSVATFADEADAGAEPGSPGDGKRESLRKRLSTGSAELLRRLSQRSRGKSMGEMDEPGESSEVLVESKDELRDDNDSVAANMDDMSSNGDDDAIHDRDGSRTIAMTAQLRDTDEQSVTTATARRASASSRHPSIKVARNRVSSPETIATDILAASEAGEPAVSKAETTEQGPKAEATEVSPSEAGSARESDAKSSKRPKSTMSAESVPTSLTRANLPRSLSRVAMSYRTNEWAKHLSAAETPELDALKLKEYAEQAVEDAVGEAPAPLNMSELQQTAENAAPPPAAPRSASVMSNYALAQQAPSRSGSRASTYQQQMQLQRTMSPPPEAQGRSISSTGPPPTHQNKAANYRSKSGTLHRQTSLLLSQPIAEEGSEMAGNILAPGLEDGNPSGPNSVSPSPIPPVPGVVSYSSPQTLIGKRDMLLRSKSYGSFIMPTPDPHAQALAALVANSASTGHLPTVPASNAPSDAGSTYNYPLHTAPMDVDDLPLSQRRELMRHASGASPRPASGMALQLPAAMVSAPAVTAEAAVFNSHQPARGTHIASEAARQSQLANFRNSVAAELRAGSALGSNDPHAGGRETPAGPLLYGAGGGGLGATASAGEAKVRYSIDASRSFLLGQKEAETQRREMERQERERDEREFELRMRSGELMEAHRDAMRRLQGGVKNR